MEQEKSGVTESDNAETTEKGTEEGGPAYSDEKKIEKEENVEQEQTEEESQEQEQEENNAENEDTLQAENQEENTLFDPARATNEEKIAAKKRGTRPKVKYQYKTRSTIDNNPAKANERRSEYSQCRIWWLGNAANITRVWRLVWERN